MNLLATDCAVEILRALAIVFVVPPTVASEALYRESGTAGDARTQIDLAPLVAAGALRRTALHADEIDRVVELARLVDDGEAEVMAIALARAISMATDDRRARRLATERGVALLSTPDLLQRWQASAAVPSARLRQILALVSRRSRYRPPRGHPLYDWWMSLLTALP